jgi:hypothetical protein
MTVSPEILARYAAGEETSILVEEARVSRNTFYAAAKKAGVKRRKVSHGHRVKGPFSKQGADFERKLMFLWALRWRADAPKELGVSLSTLDRYVNGHVRASRTALAALDLKVEQEEARRAQRAAEGRWCPTSPSGA